MGLKQPLPRSLGTRLCRGPIHNGLNAQAATFQVLSSAVRFPCSSPPGCTLSPSSLRLPKDFDGLAPQDSLQKTLPSWRPLPPSSSMLVSPFSLAWAHSSHRDSHTQSVPFPSCPCFSSWKLHFVNFYFLAVPHGTWVLSPPHKVWTRAPCIRSTKS